MSIAIDMERAAKIDIVRDEGYTPIGVCLAACERRYAHRPDKTREGKWMAYSASNIGLGDSPEAAVKDLVRAAIASTKEHHQTQVKELSALLERHRSALSEIEGL